MANCFEDVVVVTPGDKPGDPYVITVNCPDKTGLGCDLCRIILLFGLNISRGDVSTDGKWCFLVFWIVEKPGTRWDLLKNRLLEVCPSQFSTSGLHYYQLQNQHPNPPDIFLLKFWCSSHNKGLLHDVTDVLCELELTIKRVKVSTAPDGRVMDLFFITDTRELLHTRERQEETIHRLRVVLRDTLLSCEIELVGREVIACSHGPSNLPPSIDEDMFSLELPSDHPPPPYHRPFDRVGVRLTNRLSPSHTVIQVLCRDHKGLIYDIMKTLKDYNIQVSYGRFLTSSDGMSDMELFMMQADGKKILDNNKRDALCSRLRMELLRPLRVNVVSRGPDTELFVANPVELSGGGRPLVFHDITLALKHLNTTIFSAEIGRHMIGDREWELYRILLDEGDEKSIPRKLIEQGVRNRLMGW